MNIRCDGPLREAVARREIAGVVAMATDRKRVLYQGAFGLADLPSGRAMTADALFKIASMTKPITSAAVMQLVEQGRIALDDPVVKHLPQFAKLSVFESFDPATGDYRLRPAAEAVTIRHLLTHTSGLGYDFISPTLRDFKPRAGENYLVGPLLFEPGTQWLYGTNTDWLGRLVEKVSRLPLETYFRQHIFDPLSMADTFYFIPESKEARLAAVNRREADGALVKEPNQPAVRGFTPIGGAGLASTAADYVRFVRMLLNGGELDGTRVLSAASVAAMGENQIGELCARAVQTALPGRSNDFSFVADGRDKWGLGFLITADSVPGKRSAGSLSWGGIFNTYFWIDPARGVAGVILMHFLPFADRQALALYDAFERGVYQIA
jgi:CubicO group peptidase (beta-lactamase class C family)